MKTSSRVLLGSVVTIALCGCASTNDGNGLGQRADFSPKVPAYSKTNTPHELVKQGVAYLREGDYEKAQVVFSAAVKVAPSNSVVHILNGISYHLQYLNNSPDSKTLAETAYGIASSLDKSDPLPLIQLGRLHIDSGEYSRASVDFVSAYALSPSDQEALSGLMQASLLQKDFKTALWAGEKLTALNPTAEKQRVLVLMYAAAGRPDDANQQLALYEKAHSKDQEQVRRLREQIRYISTQVDRYTDEVKPTAAVYDYPAHGAAAPSKRAQYMKVAGPAYSNGGRGSEATAGSADSANRSLDPTAGSAAGRSGASGAATSSDSTGGTSSSTSSASTRSGGTSSGAAGEIGAAKLMSTNSSSSSDSSGSTSSSPAVASGAASAGAPATSGGGGGGAYTSVSTSQQKQKWFDCDTRPGLGKAPGGSYGVPVGGTAGDQTLYLEPIPAPCDKLPPPKMAMIDAVLIRTVDTQSSSFGINLLTGLQIFAGTQKSSTTTQVAGNSVTENVTASVLGIGNAASATLNGISGILSYTLNIANSTTSNSQVVARPTLTALDRIPSTFYSGSVQTVGLNGGGVSGAQVTNIPTGVSLSVTPTFIDDDTMMLAVKASRSFIANTAAVGGFNAGIGIAQHAVTANVRVKYGETLVLDGLTDRESSRGQDGVPVLQDIPIIQYLFNNVTRMQYAENVLVLITPRKLVADAKDLQAAEDAESKRERGELTTKEYSVYQSMKTYRSALDKMYPNLDGAIRALDRDSAYFRQFKTALLNSDEDAWVSQPPMTRFFNDAANMLYFTR